MNVITKAVKADKYNYYIKHLEIINVILPEDKFPEKISKKEIEVLAAFMSQDNNLIKEDMFNGVVRKKVMDKLNMKPGGLGNHLKALIDKEFLLKDKITKRITVKSFLVPVKNGQGYRIKLLKV